MKEGDYKRLSEITGYTWDYIWRVLAGSRKSDFIVMMAREYLQGREDLTVKARSMRQLVLPQMAG